MAKTKLYDLENTTLDDLETDGFPNKPGDEFRSVQVFKCPICGAKTNRITGGGHPPCGIRFFCPNSGACWHHILEEKCRGLRSESHPTVYADALHAEIEEFRMKYADCARDDLVGEPDMTQLGEVTNTRVIRYGTFCLHGPLLAYRTLTEADIEFSDTMAKRVKELGPYAGFEKLIENEHRFVQAKVRERFYGFDAQALLFPNDDIGPGVNDESIEGLSWRDVRDRARSIIDRVFASQELTTAMECYSGEKEKIALMAKRSG